MDTQDRKEENRIVSDIPETVFSIPHLKQADSNSTLKWIIGGLLALAIVITIVNPTPIRFGQNNDANVASSSKEQATTTDADTEVSTSKSASTTPTTYVNLGFSANISGKEYTGMFTTLSRAIAVRDGSIEKAKITFDASSAMTGDPTIDSKLCTKEVFDCNTYPTISFSVMSFSIENGEYTAHGILEYKGVSKGIIFPVTFRNSVYAFDFRLDSKLFGLSYPGLKGNVRVMGTVTLK